MNKVKLGDLVEFQRGMIYLKIKYRAGNIQ